MTHRPRIHSGLMGAFSCLGVLFPISSAYAQAQPLLNISFTLGDPATGVPLSPWATGLLSAILVSATLVVLRRQRRLLRHLPSWVVFATGIAAFAAGSILALGGRDAQAQVLSVPVPLQLSPAVVALSPNPTLFQAINETDRVVTISSMFITNGACYQIFTPPTTCSVGTSLQPRDACIVAVAPLLDLCPG